MEYEIKTELRRTYVYKNEKVVTFLDIKKIKRDVENETVVYGSLNEKEIVSKDFYYVQCLKNDSEYKDFLQEHSFNLKHLIQIKENECKFYFCDTTYTIHNVKYKGENEKYIVIFTNNAVYFLNKSKLTNNNSYNNPVIFKNKDSLNTKTF